MKQILLLLATIITFASCKKEKQSDDIKTSKQMVSQKVTYEDGSVRNIAYSFDAQNRAISMSYDKSKTNFSYPDRYKIIEEHFFEGNLITIIVHDLNEEGLAIKTWVKNASGKMTDEMTYEYDKNGYLVKYIQSSVGKVFQIEYLIQNDRLISRKEYINDVFSASYTYFYDIVMPYKGDPMYKNIPYCNAFGKRSAFLPTAQKGFNASGVMGFYAQFTWSFDKYGYPVQRETKNLVDNSFYKEGFFYQ